jgi:hypothetical protein
VERENTEKNKCVPTVTKSDLARLVVVRELNQGSEDLNHFAG